MSPKVVQTSFSTGSRFKVQTPFTVRASQAGSVRNIQRGQRRRSIISQQKAVAQRMGVKFSKTPPQLKGLFKKKK